MKRALGIAALAAAACGAPAEPARVELAGLSLEAALEPAAPHLGENRMLVALRDAEGRPVEGAGVAVRVHMHGMGAMPPMGGPANVREVGAGRYRADFGLDMGGTWRVEIEAQPKGGAPVRAEGSLSVGQPGLRLEAARAAPHAAHAGGAHPAEFSIPAGRAEEIGVRSAAAERRSLEESVRATGAVAYDETAVVEVSLKVGGWIRSLRANALGARVERGDVLFTLYSPELYAAQEEYLQALRSRAEARGSGAPGRADRRVRSARTRLALWDVATAELDALAVRGELLADLAIRSPASGYVIEKDVVEGAAVERGQRLLRIAPLDRIWIEAEVYERDLPLVAEGLPASVELPHLPGRSYEGRVAAFQPALSPETRTARARIVLENPELALRPGMWATVHFHVERGERLVVPQSAVLAAGERSFVFLDLGGGRYRPRPVEVGLRSGEYVEIVSGLEAGERVVAAGTFLIAAESRLRAALDQW